MKYEDDMRIDESALDVECLDQANLMLKYTTLQAELQREEEQIREELDLKRAELDKYIRSDPDDYDIDKITEAVVNNTIIKDPGYKKINQEYIDAKFENNVAKGAVRAIAARKDMLERLILLHGQQYFAGPKMPRDLSFEAKAKHDRAQTNRGVGRSLKRKKT
jgi:hypothetical protein